MDGSQPGPGWYVILDADYGSGVVAKFDIASGKMLESFVATPSGVDGLAVVGEPQPATSVALVLTPVNPTAQATVGNTVTYAMQVSTRDRPPGCEPGGCRHTALSATFVQGGSSSGAAPTVQNGVATFSLGNLAAGASATITVVVRADVKGTVVVSAAASSNAPNTTPTAAIVTTTTTVSDPITPDATTPPVQVPPVLVAPTVIGLQRGTSHSPSTDIFITFSQDMNASQAQNVGNLPYSRADAVFRGS